MDTSVAFETVKTEEPEMLPKAAYIVVVPAATDVARPVDPDALLIVATEATDELHVTDAVTSFVLPSVYVPVAVNCLVAPTAMLALAGVTAIDLSVTCVTVNVVMPDIFPDTAEISVVPAATDEANPLEPDTLPTVATEVMLDAHVTEGVRFLVLPSE